MSRQVHEAVLLQVSLHTPSALWMADGHGEVVVAFVLFLLRDERHCERWELPTLDRDLVTKQIGVAAFHDVRFLHEPDFVQRNTGVRLQEVQCSSLKVDC